MIGVGFGLSISTGSSVVTLAADPDQTSIAVSINSVLRRVGGGVGAQIAAALLAADTVSGTGAPSPKAFTVAFAAAAVVAVAGAVMALLIRPAAPAAR